MLSRTGKDTRPFMVLGATMGIARLHRDFGATGVLARLPRDLGLLQRRQWHRNMLVNCLPLVIVFGVHLAIGPGNGLSGLVGFEAQLADFMLVGLLVVVQPLVAQH